MATFAIQSNTNPSDWWSRQHGWVENPARTLFTEYERATTPLPDGGRWTEVDPDAAPVGPHDDEFPDPHHHHPETTLEGGEARTNVFACDSEGRHYHLSVALTDEGVIFDVWDRHGEECLTTFARTWDELVDFLFAQQP